MIVIKKIFAFIISLSLIVGTSTILTVKNIDAKANPKDPRVNGDVTTWDCIYFGHYFQGSTKKKSSIKWRVLNVTGDDAFVVSDKVLDCKRYNETYDSVTWESCSLRTWLNNGFMDAAFNSNEKAAINKVTINNSDNPYHGTEGGEKTSDNVFLLSVSNVTNKSYGFNDNLDTETKTRQCKATKYAKKKGVGVYTKDKSSPYCDNCWWWLRTPGYDNYTASKVNHDGLGDINYYDNVAVLYFGIRPALHINLSKSVWSSAGTVKSKGATKVVKRPSNVVTNNVTIKTPNTNTTSHNTTTGSRLGFQYGNYGGLLSSLYPSSNFDWFKNTLAYSGGQRVEGIIIPGLERTNQGKNTSCNTMVPQGVCVAGDYLLISAYDYNHNYDSVIYVLNKKTRHYLTTIVLEDNKSHVGGIAWNHRNDQRGEVYIAGSTSNSVWRMPLSTINQVVSQGEDVARVSGLSRIIVEHVASYLTYFNGKLYVGVFKDNSYGKLVSYTLTDSGVSFKETEITLPINTQGIDVDDKGDYLIVSSSLGRNNASNVRVYPLIKAFGNIHINIDVPIINKNIPNMSEDVSVNGDYLYTGFESASRKYCPEPINKNNSQNPFDRISISSLSSMYYNGKSTKSKSEKNIESNPDDISGIKWSDNTLTQGTCGDDLTYTLFYDGTLVISGNGDMYDYDEEDAPWTNHLSQIKKVRIGSNVTSIGSYSFVDATELEEVEVSDFIDEDTIFIIGDNAFENCEKLKDVYLPKANYSLGTDLFIGTDAKVYSDSDELTEYCEQNEVKIHNHSYQYIETVERTCGQEGYDIYKCDCGECYHDNFKDPTGDHVFELTDHMESTDLIKGYNHYKCKNCLAEYEDDLELLPQTTERKHKELSTSSQSNKLKKVKLKQVKNVRKRSVKIIFNRVKNAKKYQIQCSNNKRFKKVKNYYTRKTKYRIKQLKKKKKYFFRVRAISGNYKGAWSRIKKVKINK